MMIWPLFVVVVILSLIMGPLSGFLVKRKTPGGAAAGMYFSLLGACLGITIVNDYGKGWWWFTSILGAIVIPVLWSLVGEKEEVEEKPLIEEKAEEKVEEKKGGTSKRGRKKEEKK